MGSQGQRRVAAIYSRISHDPEGRQLGVERQEEDCLRLAERHGWLPLPPYRENDTSASTRSRKPRPVYERMLDDLRDGKASVLLAYSTSRLTRRPVDYERLFELVRHTGLQIHTVVSGPIELATSDGRTVARVLAAFDAGEVERCSERLARAAVQRKRQGRWVGGRPGYGYAFEQDSHGHVIGIRINDREAALVREAAERVTLGEGLTQVTRDWNLRGIRRRSGREWYPSDLRSILVRPSIAGMSEVDEEFFAGSWPGVLDRDQWEAVQITLTCRGTGHPRQRHDPRAHPMAGLLHCGLCGAELYWRAQQDKPPRYACGSPQRAACRGISIAESPLQHYLLEEIHRRLSDEPSITSDARRVERLTRRNLWGLQDDYYKGLVERQDFIRQQLLLTDRLVAARARKAQVRSRVRPNDSNPTAEMVRATLFAYLDRVDIGPHPAFLTRRPETLAERLAVLSIRATLHWPPSPAVGLSGT